MNKNYETVAREAGYGILQYTNSLYFWVCYDDTSDNTYSSEHEAWKACCEENDLL